MPCPSQKKKVRSPGPISIRWESVPEGKSAAPATPPKGGSSAPQAGLPSATLRACGKVPPIRIKKRPILIAGPSKGRVVQNVEFDDLLFEARPRPKTRGLEAPAIREWAIIQLIGGASGPA